MPGASLEHRVRRSELTKTPAFCAHPVKYRSLVPSIALFWHVAQVADGAPAGPVNLAAARSAVEWADFLEAHARKVYAAELAGTSRPPKPLAEKIKAGALSDSMTVRAIKERDWSCLTQRGAVHEAIEVLEDLGWCGSIPSSPRAEVAPPKSCT